MASIDELLADIEAAPAGPQVAAMFDFDGTIIAGYSAMPLIREQLRRGDIAPAQLLELAAAMASFGLGKMGFSGLVAVNAQFMRGIDEKSYRELGVDLYNNHIARRVYPESRKLVQAHLARGHTVVVVSSATRYQLQTAADDLDIEHVLCTGLEVKKGKFTGAVEHPACFGRGKLDAAESMAEAHGIDLDQSFFYSDSHEDRLLLERVGLPRALNPDRKLQRLARRESWPVARFRSRGRPSVGEYLRSVATTG
ncbi:MAG: HAD family hydrolase, partial [Lysobacterales bacterium]